MNGALRRVLQPDWLARAARGDSHRASAASTLWVVTLALMAGLSVVFPLGLMDPRNTPAVLFAFNAPLMLGMAAVLVLTARGHERVAGWLLCVSTFVLVSMVLVFAGGLRGHNAIAYTLTVTVAGVVLGLGPGVLFAVLACGFSGAVAWAQETGRLPAPLSPDTAFNAWTALTVTLTTTTLVIGVSRGVLNAALADARRLLAEKNATQARLAEAQKMELVGRLTAGVAHDLNNVLTVMRCLSDMLTEDAGPRAGMLGELSAAMDRATAMTRRLVTFGRPGALTEEVRALDLHAALLEALPLLRRLVGDRQRLETVGLEPGTVWVKMGALALDQVLLNLVINAADAQPDGGVIRVSARADAPGAFEVTDHGVGMDDATRARMFEPFFTTKATGTGLGLATVRELVAAAGGTLEVWSRPGQGARFTVQLAGVPPPNPVPRRSPLGRLGSGAFGPQDVPHTPAH